MENGLESKFSWLALKMIPYLGNITYKRLIEKFGNPENVFKANLNDLIMVEGLSKKTAYKIINRAWEGNPEKELTLIKKNNFSLITMSDKSYPNDLREIHDPPPLLYMKGNELPLDKTMIAVIGSRRPSQYGLKIAEEICINLSKNNIAVVSGMAIGIDSASHWGSLRGGGPTVAVLGSGIDVIYPQSNRKLYNLIAENGSVITEFPLGTPPEGKNFPVRNRIISGLSRGVVVIEASSKSGTMITASLALEQGREVFAVPGSIESFKSVGTHFLIKQGAKLIENANDILEELGLMSRNPNVIGNNTKITLPLMSDNEKEVYDILGNYPVHIDQIVRYSKIEPGRISGLLTELELKGIIKQLPGKMFILS
jgi:DNA processing protein